MRWKSVKEDKENKLDEGYPEKGWAGWTLQGGSGVFVKHVEEGAPANTAGIAPGDEVVAIDGYRTRSNGEVEDLLATLGEGATANVSLSRRGRLFDLQMTLRAEPKRKWELEVSPKASASSKRRLKRWLTTRGKSKK